MFKKKMKLWRLKEFELKEMLKKSCWFLIPELMTAIVQACFQVVWEGLGWTIAWVSGYQQDAVWIYASERDCWCCIYSETLLLLLSKVLDLQNKQLFLGVLILKRFFYYFCWSLRQSGVPEDLVNGVMSLHEGAISVEEELSDSFSKKVGVHQGSALSTLTFVTVVYILTEYVRDGSLIDLLHAINLALCGESLDKIMGKYQRWKMVLEGKCLRVDVKKTKVIVIMS